MQLIQDSELMKNQKQAKLMAPDVSFSVIQSTEGYSIFFSISTDHIFYATREIESSNTGWTKIDLSSSLSKLHPNASIAAKSFALCQNPVSLVFDAVLVITVSTTSTVSGKAEIINADHLYMSLNNPNDKWGTGLTWTEMPFDSTSGNESTLKIADVYMLNTRKENKDIQSYFVDVQRTPFDSLKLLDRYYIDPTSTPHWVRHALPIDLRAGSIKSCLGQRKGDFVPGIYTLGAIGGPEEESDAPKEIGELIFVPQSNPFRPTDPPNPARLQIPGKPNFDYTSIASAPSKNGDTNLFIAAAEGLYLFTPDNQRDRAEAYLITPPNDKSDVLKDVVSLSASTMGSRSVLWGLNAQRQLFYIYCEAGQEYQRTAWSNPIPILSDVENYSFFINPGAEINVLFAHLSKGELVQLTQDPQTWIWTKRNIFLPSTDIKNVMEFYSFTTRIVTADDNGVMVPNTSVSIAAKSRFSAYINNVYYVLTPGTPLKLVSDATGEITVVQESENLAAAAFAISIPNGHTLTVDPLSKAHAKLSMVKDGKSLGGIEIPTEDGKTGFLVAPTVSDKDKTATASAISQLAKINVKLNSISTRETRNIASESELPIHFALVFGNHGYTYHEGEDAIQDVFQGRSNMTSRETRELKSSVGDIADGVAVLFGDLYRFAESVWDEVSAFVVSEIKGIYHLVLRIGETWYKAILDSVQAAMGAVEIVFQKIGVFFKDLVAWLGFIFNWGDILRTHKILKLLIKATAASTISAIESLKAKVQTTLDDAGAALKQAAVAESIGKNIGNAVKEESTKVESSKSPQSNWGTYHFKNGVRIANSKHEPSSVPKDQESLLHNLWDLAKDEGREFLDAIETLKELIADRDNMFSLDPMDLMKKVLLVCSALALKTAKTIILAVFDVAEFFIQQLVSMLDAEIKFPVISWVYEKLTDEKLSILDGICLVCAIPATIIFKAVGGYAPFPDDGLISKLLEVKNFDQLQAVLAGSPPGKHSSAVRSMAASAASLPTQGWRDIIVEIANYVALTASFLSVITQAISDKAEFAIRFLAVGVSVVYDFPALAWALTEPEVDWPYIMNDICCFISWGFRGLELYFGYTALLPTPSTPAMDKMLALTYADAVLGVVWFAADLGYFIKLDKRAGSDITGLMSDILDFVASSIALPIERTAEDIEVKAIAMAAYGGLAACYGVACAGTATARMMNA